MGGSLVPMDQLIKILVPVIVVLVSNVITQCTKPTFSYSFYLNDMQCSCKVKKKTDGHQQLSSLHEWRSAKALLAWLLIYPAAR